MDFLLSRVLAVRMEILTILAFCFHASHDRCEQIIRCPHLDDDGVHRYVHLHDKGLFSAIGSAVCRQYLNLPTQSLPHCTENNNLATDRIAQYHSKCEGYNMLLLVINMFLRCLLSPAHAPS